MLVEVVDFAAIVFFELRRITAMVPPVPANAPLVLALAGKNWFGNFGYALHCEGMKPLNHSKGITVALLLLLACTGDGLLEIFEGAHALR